MSRMTSQAAEIVEVLRSYGLRHRAAKVQGITQPADFRVKTESVQQRDRETGQRWREYGHAYGHSWNTKGAQVIADNAEAIAAKVQGHVYLYWLQDDKGLRLVTAMVDSQYAKDGRVVRYVNNDRVQGDPMAKPEPEAQPVADGTVVYRPNTAQGEGGAWHIAANHPNHGLGTLCRTGVKVRQVTAKNPVATCGTCLRLHSERGTVTVSRGTQSRRTAMAATTRRTRSSRPTCTHCNERPVGPSADALNIGPPAMCDRCYDEAGLENEHSDYGHDEPVQGCPACELSTVGKDEQATQQPLTRTRKPGGTRKAADTSRPTKYQVAEQYGDRIIKGRDEAKATWLKIAQVLGLITEDADEPARKWGSVVVWNAYVIAKQARGEQPVRKLHKGNGKAQANGQGTKREQVGAEYKAAGEQRKAQAKADKANRPAKTPAQRQRKALGLDALESAEVQARLQGRTITYTYSVAPGTSQAKVAQFDKVAPAGKEQLPAVWFYETVSVDEKARRTFASNLRTVYLHQIVEVS